MTLCEICQRETDGKPTCGCVVLRVELKGDQAAALAQFLKRLLLDDFMAKCAPRDTRPTATEEAMQYTMQAAASRVAKALADLGHNPR